MMTRCTKACVRLLERRRRLVIGEDAGPNGESNRGQKHDEESEPQKIEQTRKETCKFQSKPPTETTPLRGKSSSKVSSLITSITGHTTRVGSSAMRSKRGSNQPEGRRVNRVKVGGREGKGQALAKREMVVDPKTSSHDGEAERKSCVMLSPSLK